MADEIIDLRDRIEKMRIEIENEVQNKFLSIHLDNFTKKLVIQTFPFNGK